MAISTGARGAINEALSWTALAGCMIVSVIYFDEINSTIKSAIDYPSPAPQIASSEQSGRRSERAAQTASPDPDAQPEPDTLSEPDTLPAPASLAEPATDTEPASAQVTLHADQLGQFRASAEFNGSQTRVLVDTGASSVALTNADAREAGIFPDAEDYTVRIQTANGIGRAAPVMIDAITIGDITIHNVRALVNEPGTLHITLLGMTFLNRLNGVAIRSGKMVLKQ